MNAGEEWETYSHPQTPPIKGPSFLIHVAIGPTQLLFKLIILCFKFIINCVFNAILS